MSPARKTVLAVLLLVMAGGVYHFASVRNDTLEAALPRRGPAIEAVYATGTVEPVVMVPIAAQSPARLVSLLSDEGQQVKKDQQLGQLEDEELQKSLSEAEANADLAQKNYDRQKELVRRGAVSAQAMDQASTDLSAALARVAQIKASLDHMKLVSPVDGTVIRRDGEIGELIPANQAVLWVAACCEMRISAEVDEEDIISVKPQQEVVIQADAFPGQTFKGTVQSITPKGDPVSRSYRVRIALENGTPLLSGMTAETNIILRRDDNALLVPASAVSDNAVWLVKNGHVTRQSVTVGARTSQAAEITVGLAEGDTVLLDGSQKLQDGQAVHTKPAEWKAF